MNSTIISKKMKIFLLVLMLLSITCYASGCIVLANSGYKLSDYKNEINTMFPGDFKFNFESDDFNLGFNQSTSSSQQPLESNINDIQINLTSQNIDVKTYDGNTIKIQIKSNSFNNSAALPCTKSNNKLIFNATSKTPRNAHISIRIPSSYKNKGNLTITTSSGDINVSDVYVKSSSISTASGSLYVSNSSMDYLVGNSSSGDINLNQMVISSETKITSTSGDILGNGDFGLLTCNSTSGDINFEVKNTLKDTSINTISGDIILSTPNNSGYKIAYTTKSGDFNVPNGSLSSGDETAKLTFNTTSGDISVK